MSKFNYVAKQSVRAAQWKDGKSKDDTNLEEMAQLLHDVVDSNEYVDWIEPYHFPSGRSGGGYHVLTFYAGDDMEVDPGNWVVVYEDGEVKIMTDTQFHKMFRKND